jgi:hypothetical protein
MHFYSDYYDLYIFRQHVGRRKILDKMVADIFRVLMDRQKLISSSEASSLPQSNLLAKETKRGTKNFPVIIGCNILLASAVM